MILHNFTQWLVANTFPRDAPASQPKGWIQGNLRIGLVLEVTTSFQHFKYGIEIRIESVNKTILILDSEFPMEQSIMWSIVLFNDFLEVILLILYYRTMWEAHSIFTQLSAMY